MQAQCKTAQCKTAQCKTAQCKTKTTTKKLTIQHNKHSNSAFSNRMSDSDDDLQLSTYTIAALQEFMAKQLQKNNEQEHGTDFEEDWQLSQFWVLFFCCFHMTLLNNMMQYDHMTSDTIVEKIIEYTKGKGCLS
jgi:hypothetical protein